MEEGDAHLGPEVSNSSSSSSSSRSRSSSSNNNSNFIRELFSSPV